MEEVIYVDINFKQTVKLFPVNLALIKQGFLWFMVYDF